MKLTKLHREAFVRAVIQDLPQIDYEAMAHKLVQEKAIEALPAKLRPVALDKELRTYLTTDTMWFNQHATGIGNCAVFSGRGGYFRLNDKDQITLDEIMASAQHQRDERKRMEERMAGVIAACTTVKMAKTHLPEFEKYLPKEVEKTNNLPAIANIVADLTKLGWPKDKTPATV